MIAYPGRNIVSRPADTNGDGSGTDDATVDYSSGEIYKVAPAENEIYSLERVIVSIEDAGNFNADGYGAIAGGLTNGITVQVTRNGGVLYTLTGFAVTSNADWAAHCYDYTEFGFAAGNRVAVVRWTFAKSGTPVVLSGDRNEALEYGFSDNFTGLVHHRFLTQGWVINQEA